jgi:hypothetical protein
MTRRVLAGKSLPGELYPHGLADLHRLDFTSADEAERLTVRCFKSQLLIVSSSLQHGHCQR